MHAGRTVRARVARLEHLQVAIAIDAVHGEAVLALGEWAFITPEYPACLGKRRADLGRLPGAVVDLHLDAGNAAVAGEGNAADGHPPLVAVFDQRVDGDAVDEGPGRDYRQDSPSKPA